MSDTTPTPPSEPKRNDVDHLAARIAAATERAAAQYGAAERESDERNAAEQMAAARTAAERAAAERETANRAAAELAEAERAAAARVAAQRVEPVAAEAERVEAAQIAAEHGPVEAVEAPIAPEPAAIAVEAVAPPPPPPPAPPPPAPPPARRTGTPIWLTVLVVLLFGAGLYYVWTNPMQTAQTAPADESRRIAALEASLKSAQDHIAALESRPAAASGSPADAARIAALEAALHDLQAKAAPDTSALDARIAELEKRKLPDVDALVASASAGLTAKIATLDAEVQHDAAEAAARTAMAAKLRTASAALASGLPLGTLPGAPPALARFATVAPPTEPALRLSFNHFADAAEAASKPAGDGHDFFGRMWVRAQMLVTVRQGDHVLVGAPAAVTLEAARGKLDAGDLAGAVAALGALDPAAAAAMAPWRADATALVDARAALAALAAKS